MEYIVLGILLYKDMTIYELNTAFKKGLFLIYSASYGSLQNAVKKLLKKDYIFFRETVENGRNKKIYQINAIGEKCFYDWMYAEITENKLETTILSKIYFLGFIKEKEDKLKIIDDMIQKTEEVRDGLSAYYKQITALELSDKEREIGKYQIKTLDYGVMSHEVAVEWLYKLRDEII